jgi:transposase
LHVGLCGRTTVQFRVGADEGQVLALLVGEEFGHFLDEPSLTWCLGAGGTAMNVRYMVHLDTSERQRLELLVAGGKRPTREVKRAQILLAADGGSTDEEIVSTVQVAAATVYRTRRRFVEEGLDRALTEDPRPGGKRKLSTTEEAMLVALACASPPAGRAQWTLELLAGEMVRLTPHETLSRATVGRRLAENDLKPWQRKMWCIPKVDAEFVARMEDVLDLYTTPPAPGTTVICFDETPRQLIGEARVPVRAEPGRRARYDYEYRRNGTANVFMFLDAHRPWRHAKVTEHRAAVDFAECMRDLVDEHYPDADCIKLVLDNLSTHSPGALYEAFPPEEARRILRRLEFHYTPKHASWLNMVEIEIGVLVAQCLERRISDIRKLTTEVAAWARTRNADKAKVRWMFGIDKAREKLGRAYPQPTATPAALAA